MYIFIVNHRWFWSFWVLTRTLTPIHPSWLSTPRPTGHSRSFLLLSESLLVLFGTNLQQLGHIVLCQNFDLIWKVLFKAVLRPNAIWINQAAEWQRNDGIFQLPFRSTGNKSFRSFQVKQVLFRQTLLDSKGFRLLFLPSFLSLKWPKLKYGWCYGRLTCSYTQQTSLVKQICEQYHM